MRSIYIILFIVVSVSFGCNKKEKQEIARLTQENQTLMNQSHLKDSTINNVFQSLNEIETNLAVIKEKESVISVKSSAKDEMSPEIRTRINNDIKIINVLMSKNKKELARLRKLVKESNLKIGEFEKKIAELNEQIIQRDNQIASLKDDLSKMNFSMAALNASLDTMRNEQSQLKSIIEEKTNSINTAYYITGSKKQLLSENIIKKEGGFIGIGKTGKLKPDFDESKFKRIDIRQLTEIPLNTKKAEMVTTHPKDSYKFETNTNGIIDKITITNPGKFWSTSKYLVIMNG
jgi:hypothetical protein